MTTLEVIGVEPKVLEILSGNPKLPYSTIAGEVGVTRERVRQIARRNGYPPRNGVPKPKTCPACGETYYTKKQYCSRACVYKARMTRVTVNCHHCGKPIKRTPGNMRSKSGRYFCNRECYCNWVGKDRPITPDNKGRHRVGDFEYDIGFIGDLYKSH